jgi:DNA modification methylase
METEFNAHGPYQLLPPLTQIELDNLENSIIEKGVLVPIIVDENGEIIDGHHRKMICDKHNIECPKIVRSNLTEQEKRSEARSLNVARRHLNTEQKRIVIAGEISDSPNDSNNSIAKRLGVSDVTVAKIREKIGLKSEKVIGSDGKLYKSSKGKIVEKFGYSPVSILDSTNDNWRNRKNWWKAWGIESEIARDATAFSYANQNDPVSQKMQEKNNPISLFDPVIAELMVSWHSSENSIVYDPFAGGPVRGVVTATLGRKYIGCEIRPEQVIANNENAKYLNRLNMFNKDFFPKWILEDSNTVDVPKDIDLIFTCPPYFNLEKYSELDSDISNKTEKEFIDLYSSIIKRSVQNLQDDSFCIFVVGNLRKSNGSIFDMCGLTIRSFEEAGLKYYNEYIYKSPIGGSVFRLGQFEMGRKAIKIHQTIIVGVKGDGMKASKKNPINIIDLNDELWEP